VSYAWAGMACQFASVATFSYKSYIQIFYHHASAFDCILNLVIPRHQTGVNSFTKNPIHGYMIPPAEQLKTTKRICKLL
jgi:hypothetical protein